MDSGNSPSSGPRLKDLKIAALANEHSGRCDRATGDVLRAALEDVGLTPAAAWCGPGKHLERGLDGLLAAAPDLVVVLGGDGTIRTVLDRCGCDGPLVLPLPGGTMNLVPRALYGPADWRSILQMVVSGAAVRTLHGAEAQGRTFFAAGLFGRPSLLAEAREAIRHGEVALAATRGLRAARAALERELVCAWDDGATAKGEVAAVLCPALTGMEDGSSPRIEAAVVDVDGPLDALRLLVSAAFRDWRADPDVRCALTDRLEVRSSEPIPGLLDGEAFTFAPSLTIKAAAAAVRILAPTPQQASGEPREGSLDLAASAAFTAVRDRRQ